MRGCLASAREVWALPPAIVPCVLAHASLAGLGALPDGYGCGASPGRTMERARPSSHAAGSDWGAVPLCTHPNYVL